MVLATYYDLVTLYHWVFLLMWPAESTHVPVLQLTLHDGDEVLIRREDLEVAERGGIEIRHCGQKNVRVVAPERALVNYARSI